MNSVPAPASLIPARLPWSALGKSLAAGWRGFLATRRCSVAYSMIFALAGLALLLGIERANVAPMMLPAAGGFMLVGPIVLTGFFALDPGSPGPREASLAGMFAAFTRAPRALWTLALVCALLFMIWITDAATLYGFMVGRMPTPLAALTVPPEGVLWFIGWSSLMGAALALLIFAVSAFAVPLIYDRRAGLVAAIVASVSAVFANLPLCLGWAVLLATATIGSILLLPLFPVVFPIMALASLALYRAMFPPP